MPQTIERMIQGENRDAIGGGSLPCVVDGHRRKTVTALGRPMAACVIHENPAHHLRRNAEEMRPIPPVALPLVDQAQVELVNERGGLQREATPFAAKLAYGHATQLRVDERQQLVEGIRVTTPPFGQKRRYVGPGRHVVEREAFSIENPAAFRNRRSNWSDLVLACAISSRAPTVPGRIR